MKKKLLSIILSLAMAISMVPMMTVTSCADDDRTPTYIARDIAQNLLAVATLNTSAKKTAAIKVTSAFTTTVVKCQDAMLDLRKMSNNLVDAIGLSKTDEQAAAIGTLGAAALDSYATIHNNKKDTRVIDGAVTAAIAAIAMQTSGTKAAALGEIGAKQCKTLAKEPDLVEISEAVAMLYAAIATDSDNAASSIVDLGKRLLDTMVAAPDLASVIVAELAMNLASISAEDHKQYTVTFETNGGSTINAVKVTSSKTVEKPIDPTKTDCVFVNWYSDSSLTTVWNFSNKITKDTTLYAKWTDDPKIEEEMKAQLNATVMTIAAAFDKNGNVSLTWNKNENAAGYEVFANTEYGQTLVKKTADNETVKTLTTVAPSYSVRAYALRNDKTYYGDESEAAELKLAKAKISSLKSSTKKQATVKYGKVKGAQTYEIKYKIGDGKWKTTTATKLSKTIKKLTSGKKVSVKVRGIYSVGSVELAGSWSATKSVKIKQYSVLAMQYTI